MYVYMYVYIYIYTHIDAQLHHTSTRNIFIHIHSIIIYTVYTYSMLGIVLTSSSTKRQMMSAKPNLSTKRRTIDQNKAPMLATHVPTWLLCSTGSSFQNGNQLPNSKSLQSGIHEPHANWLNHQPKNLEIIRNHPKSSPTRRQQAQLPEDGQGLDDAQGPNDAHQLHHPQTVGLLILNSPTPQRWLWIKPPGRGLISFNVIQSSSSGLVCFNHVPLRKNHPVFRKATTSHQLLLLNGKKSSKSLGWFQPPEWGRETAQDVETHQASIKEVQIHDPLTWVVDPLLSHLMLFCQICPALTKIHTLSLNPPMLYHTVYSY